MIIRITLLFSLFIFSNCLNAQLLNINPLDIPLAPKNFNAETIKKNKIKSILVVIADKPDGSVIIDKGATQGYEFDKKGNLLRYYYTILNNAENKEIEVPEIIKRGRIIRPATTRTVTNYNNDTIFVNLYYDSVNRIICKRINSFGTYEATYYEYNSASQIIKQMHCAETNINENKKEFTLGVQSNISVETFEYIVLSPFQLKVNCLNDEKRIYKTGIRNFDGFKNKLSENYEYSISWMKQQAQWKYDSFNRIAEKQFTSNENGEINSRSIYEYDSVNNLISEKKFNSDSLVVEMNYLYDEKTNLIKSEVNRQHQKSSIDIVKYGYSFYD